MVLRFTHVVVCVCSFFLFLIGEYAIIYLSDLLFKDIWIVSSFGYRFSLLGLPYQSTTEELA